MHRDGGISHGNNTGGSLAYKYYLEDSILLTQQEILPYLELLTFQQKRRALKRYRDTQREYGRKFLFSEMGIIGKVSFILKYGDYYFSKFLYSFFSFFDYRSEFCFEAGLGSLFASFLLSLVPTLEKSGMILFYLFGLFGIALVLFSVITKIGYLALELLRMMKMVIKFLGENIK